MKRSTSVVAGRWRREAASALCRSIDGMNECVEDLSRNQVLLRGRCARGSSEQLVGLARASGGAAAGDLCFRRNLHCRFWSSQCHSKLHK